MATGYHEKNQQCLKVCHIIVVVWEVYGLDISKFDAITLSAV